MMDENKDLLKYFIEHTNQQFGELKQEMRSLREEVKLLSQFKWKVAGAAAALGAVGVFVFEALKSLVRGG